MLVLRLKVKELQLTMGQLRRKKKADQEAEVQNHKQLKMNKVNKHLLRMHEVQEEEEQESTLPKYSYS